ncbi:MAG: transporter substrate-binding domain-containing protein, partial [Acidimicrobiales bacterium]
MKTTWLRLLAILLAFGLIAAACGDDDDDTATEPAPEETDDGGEEPEPEPEDDGGEEMAFDLEGRTVTIAVENAYLPFNYIDPDTGEAAGWDYDVIDDICGRLNCVADYQTFTWEPMIQAVADGQFDMAADGITITPERAEVVAFSDGYINIEQRILVGIDNEDITSADDLNAADCPISVQIGTTNFNTAAEAFGEDRLTTFEEFAFVVEAVLAGDTCAAVVDETAGQGYIGANADQLKLVGDSLSSDQLGFIYPLGSDLVEPFNYALEQMKIDGTLEAISSEYFGDSFTISYDDIEFPECGPEEGCTEEEGGDSAAAAVPLTMGYVLPQTGGLSVIVDALVKPIEMAVEEINGAGGQLTLITGDSGTDVNVASTTVDALLNDDVNVILGPASTDVTLGVIDKITGAEIVECSGSTTGAVFSDYPDDGWYFRTSPPDSIQAPALAD